MKPFIERGNRFQKVAKQLEIDAEARRSTAKTEANADHSTLLVSTLALPRYEALFPEAVAEDCAQDAAERFTRYQWDGGMGAGAGLVLAGDALDGVSMFDRLQTSACDGGYLPWLG